MYELWDGADCLGEFHTQGAALDTVQCLTEDNTVAAEALALFEIDSDGRPTLVAGGQKLMVLTQEYV